MTLSDFGRMIQPYSRRIRNLVARVILKDINTKTTKTQLIQTQGLGGDSDDGANTDIERLQPYGLETYPYIDAEGINLNISGFRDSAVNILIHDRDLRPNDLNEGEVCLYGKDSTDSNGNRITIKPDNTIEIKTFDGNLITIDSNGIIIEDKNTNTITMNSTGMVLEDLNGNDITMEATKVTINGSGPLPSLEVLQ
jgi:phage baseplate assembly protein V